MKSICLEPQANQVLHPTSTAEHFRNSRASNHHLTAAILSYNLLHLQAQGQETMKTLAVLPKSLNIVSHHSPHAKVKLCIKKILDTLQLKDEKSKSLSTKTGVFRISMDVGRH